MGNCGGTQPVFIDTKEEFKIVTWDDFKFIKPVGKGGFGKVWLVIRKKDSKPYAMKEMYKARVLSKRSISSVINERKILAQLKHPFIVNMVQAFQDSDNLYLVMQMQSGGDLRYHLITKKKFSEKQT